MFFHGVQDVKIKPPVLWLCFWCCGCVLGEGWAVGLDDGSKSDSVISAMPKCPTPIWLGQAGAETAG